MFFHRFWSVLGGLGVSFRFFCRVGVILLGVCGLSLLLFVVPLARLGCLWARGSLRGCFLFHFRNLFHVFSVVFSLVSVVEAAPQARPKTTAVANTALRPSPCRLPSFNALPVPMLRQVSLLGRKQSSHAGKTHFFRKVQVLRFSKSTFYLHGSSFSSQN